MFARKFLKLATLISLTALNVACESSKYKKTGGSSSIQAVNVNLPAAQSTFNAYQIIIKPLQASCQNPTNINKVKLLSERTMSEKISETCSYSIEFFLGMKDPSADKLAKVVYKTATPQQITQQALQDSKKAGKPLSLALNLVNADPTSPDTPGPQIQIPGDDSLSPIDPSDGSINLPGADDLSPIDDNTGSIGGGSSLEPIGPQAALFPTDKDYDLVHVTGQKKKLSQHFTGQYLLVEVSATFCGACIQTVQSLEHDSSIDQYFSNGKCQKALFIDGDGAGSSETSSVILNNWHQRTGLSASGRMGSVSFSAQQNGQRVPSTRVASSFGRSVTTIPAFFIIDRTGNAVTQVTNSLPSSQLAQLCR